MSKILVLGAAALVFSAAGVSAADLAAPGYGYGYDNGYAPPVADFAPPAYGYAAPPYGSAGPNTTVVIVPSAPAYAVPPVASGYYGASYYEPHPVPPAPIPARVYDYAPGYGYGYTPGYWNRGYWGRWNRW